jgi:hypothetical protein
VIRTNAPFAEVSTFGVRLEALRELVFALLADVFDPARLPLAQRFADPRLKPSRTSRRHEVWYFASPREYIEFLEPLVGADAERELGRYLEPRFIQGRRVPGRSYFHRDPAGRLGSTATLYHEVSHQLLFESVGKANLERNAGNFWVWEGLGCYFETLEPQADGSLLVGGLVGPRIDEALKRILDREEFIPIGQLTTLDQRSFTRKDVASRNYAEAMALVVFLMQFAEGRYREGFSRYIRDAYDGRVDAASKSLMGHLGVSDRTLDEEFVAYLREVRR